MNDSRRPDVRTVARQIEGLPLDADLAEDAAAGEPDPGAANVEGALDPIEPVAAPQVSPAGRDDPETVRHARQHNNNEKGDVAMLKKIGLAMITAATLVALATPGDAGITVNALTQNALTQNALSSNALSPNAVNPNGLRVNGIQPNALSTNALTGNGIEPNAVNPNALYANGVNPNALSPNGTGTGAVHVDAGHRSGSVTAIELPDGTSFIVR